MRGNRRDTEEPSRDAGWDQARFWLSVGDPRAGAAPKLETSSLPEWGELAQPDGELVDTVDEPTDFLLAGRATPRSHRSIGTAQRPRPPLVMAVAILAVCSVVFAVTVSMMTGRDAPAAPRPAGSALAAGEPSPASFSSESAATLTAEPSPTPTVESTPAPASTAGGSQAASTQAPATTQAAPPAWLHTPTAGHTYVLINGTSGKALSISGSSSADGALTVQETASGAQVLQWTLADVGSGWFNLFNVRTGKVLDNPNGSQAQGVQMQQWTMITNNTNEHWSFVPVANGQYIVVNRSSTQVLDLRGTGTAEFAPIRQWPMDANRSNPDQFWQFNAVS